ncbi:MAG: glycoside hydrolase family 76 protein [Prevotellaceae bacterium]|nr:glycoside hydrolase family 76 protein [Prevotellaceae bacterium]
MNVYRFCLLTKQKNLFSLFVLSILCSYNGYCIDTVNLQRAEQTLEAIYRNYSAPNTCLLRENFPYDDRYTANYLASEEQSKRHNPYSYLWPFSGTLSAVTALYICTKDRKYVDMLDNKVLKGLEEYFDEKRLPAGYASYINSTPAPDRFYDDNVWLVIDYAEAYLESRNKIFLDKAETTWQFVISGWDDKIGGGIYWTEQKKTSKNTCSNAPSVVAAMKLFESTNNSEYLDIAIKIYEWTKSNLQDSTDFLYFDNIKLNRQLDRSKYSYNSGQMLQGAVLLYNETHDNKYLTDAICLAESCYKKFFSDSDDGKLRMFKNGNVWFNAVMFRGFVALYRIDMNSKYIDAFRKSLDYAWEHAREANGLFNQDFGGKRKDRNKWLLTQAAMVEMYARIAGL